MSRWTWVATVIAAVVLWATAGFALDTQRSGASQISRPLSGMKPSGLREGHSFCNSIRYGPCVPRAGYLLGDPMQLTVLSKPDQKDAASYVRPNRDLNTLDDLSMALRACWTPPAPGEASEGAQISVRFSLQRDGHLIGPPRVTDAGDRVWKEVRGIYFKSITASLDSCMPFRLTKGFSSAIVGRPISIHYIDNRSLKPEGSPQP